MNKLRELNAAFSITLEFISEAVCICDIRGNILHMNSRCRAIFGVSDKEPMIGLNFFERLVGPSKEELLRSYVDRSGLQRWRGDVHLFNTARRKELLLTLQSAKHVTSTGEKYLSNVLSEVLEPKEVTISIIEFLPLRKLYWKPTRTFLMICLLE
jgi:PAS domain S-box-containing protein